ncbi:MAG: hypothetical protein SOV76_07875 [Treponema succinifaciens]|nr:hypothetical protein [Treponema succinifaciens]MDY2616454.1 hypothetical protein [Treponema succinifaciens]
MSGNVFEWCWDSDGHGSNFRYFCGGCWGDYAYYRVNNLGFRIVRSTGK